MSWHIMTYNCMICDIDFGHVMAALHYYTTAFPVQGQQTTRSKYNHIKWKLNQPNTTELTTKNMTNTYKQQWNSNTKKQTNMNTRSSGC